MQARFAFFSLILHKSEWLHFLYASISEDFFRNLTQNHPKTKIFYHTTPHFTTANVSRETFSAFLHDPQTKSRQKLEIFSDVSRETF